MQKIKCVIVASSIAMALLSKTTEARRDPVIEDLIRICENKFKERKYDDPQCTKVLSNYAHQLPKDDE